MILNNKTNKKFITINKEKDFNLIYNKQVFRANKNIVIYIRQNNNKVNRVGFVASKKVGNAVARNRGRRLMKESYRLLLDEVKFNSCYDIIFLARKDIDMLSMKEVKKQMYNSMKKLNII